MEEKQTLRLYVYGIVLKGGRDSYGGKLRRTAEITFQDAKGNEFTYATTPGERLDTIYDAWETGDALTVVALVAPEYRYLARELLGGEKVAFAKGGER